MLALAQRAESRAAESVDIDDRPWTPTSECTRKWVRGLAARGRARVSAIFRCSADAICRCRMPP